MPDEKQLPMALDMTQHREVTKRAEASFKGTLLLLRAQMPAANALVLEQALRLAFYRIAHQGQGRPVMAVVPDEDPEREFEFPAGTPPSEQAP